MSISTATHITMTKYRTPIFLIFIVAGLAGNYFNYQIFLNIDFLFGSIFTMLVLQFLGLGYSIVAAAVVAGYTLVLWNHPYAIIIMTVEVAVVGMLMQRYEIGMVVADTVYWFIFGLPMVYLFYHIVMNVPVDDTFMVMAKQALNGITNALVARLIYTGGIWLSRSSKTSLSELFYNMLAFFVLFPSLLLMAISSKTDFIAKDETIRSTLNETHYVVEKMLAHWARDRESFVINIAKMAALGAPQEIQPYIKQVTKFDNNYSQIKVHFSPNQDESTKNTPSSESTYNLDLQQTTKPILSKLIMGKVGSAKPVVLMLAPVTIKDHYAGYIEGILDLGQIRGYLNNNVAQNSMFYTLLDRNGKVILTNHTDQTVTQPFVLSGGKVRRLDDVISQWLPDLPANTPIMEQWEQSVYFTESTIDSLEEWKLILEQPVLPYQKTLYDIYTQRLFILSLVLLGALMLAELLSRRINVTFKELGFITHDLSHKLMTEARDMSWPYSNIKEADHLITNFQEMTHSLSEQFEKSKTTNASLAKLVKELRESEERFSSMFRKHSAVMLLVEPESGTIIDANHAAEKFYGYPRETLLSMNVEDINMSPPDVIHAERHEMIRESKNFFIFPHRKSSGEIRTVEVHSTLISVNRTNRLFSIINDITERKQAEIALRESQREYQSTIEALLVGVVVHAADTRILLCNPEAVNILGLTAEQMMGKAAIDPLWRFVGEDSSPIRLEDYPVNKVLSTKKILGDFVLGIVRPDKEYIAWVNVNATPLLSNEGDIEKVIVNFINITERKQAEKTRASLQNQLIQAQKMEAIGTLAGGIAHDFNNILGAVLGYAEMVQEDCPTGSTMRNDIDRVVEASHRAKELVKQILAFSRQSESEIIVLQPALIIKEAMKMLRATLPKTIDIQQNIDPEAGLILADPTQIHQIITNLCTNAFHAMEETGGTLTISLKNKELNPDNLVSEPHVQPGHFVEISVRDTGPGIAPEIMDKIFDPFFTTKEVSKGTGMGLAIIHGIANKSGGFVSCKSSPDEGTTFYVCFPIHTVTAPPEAETTPLELIQTGIERILFIDDEEMLAEMGKTMLERLGYRVTVETNSIEALKNIQSQPDKFDLVITDQTMPGMTGSDLARRILQIRPELPIILCTGFSSLISEEKARIYGIKGFAMKPLAKKDLASLIRKLLDGE